MALRVSQGNSYLKKNREFVMIYRIHTLSFGKNLFEKIKFSKR